MFADHNSNITESVNVNPLAWTLEDAGGEERFSPLRVKRPSFALLASASNGDRSAVSEVARSLAISPHRVAKPQQPNGT